MSTELTLILERVVYIGALIGVALNLIRIGKAIGRIEQLLEVHSEDIRNLKNNKIDKETCEALRDD